MFDIASKYAFYLSDDNKKNVNLFLILISLERYVNGANLEMRRLERTRKALNKEISLILKSPFTGRKNNSKATYLMSDVHFYFICVDKVYKLLLQLSNELNDNEIKKLRIKLGKFFSINTVRNHLEHIDERCIGYLSLGDKKKGIKKNISDFGNFIGNDFSFNGKKFPTNKESLAELNQIYRELIKLIHENYASKDPHFINRLEMEDRAKAISKYVERIQKKQAGLR